MLAVSFPGRSCLIVPAINRGSLGDGLVLILCVRHVLSRFAAIEHVVGLLEVCPWIQIIRGVVLLHVAWRFLQDLARVAALYFV